MKDKNIYSVEDIFLTKLIKKVLKTEKKLERLEISEKLDLEDYGIINTSDDILEYILDYLNIPTDKACNGGFCRDYITLFFWELDRNSDLEILKFLKFVRQEAIDIEEEAKKRIAEQIEKQKKSLQLIKKDENKVLH